MDAAPPARDGFAFWRRQVDRLGVRDPMEVLESTPRTLRELFAQVDEETGARRPEPHRWSAREIVGHLIDVEWIFGYRCRTILADREPRFGGNDQDRWVDAHRWRDRPPKELLETFGAIRAVTCEWWRSLTPAALQREGIHTEAGVSLSLGMMRRILAGHDLIHGDQIRTALSGGAPR